MEKSIDFGGAFCYIESSTLNKDKNMCDQQGEKQVVLRLIEAVLDLPNIKLDEVKEAVLGAALNAKPKRTYTKKEAAQLENAE